MRYDINYGKELERKIIEYVRSHPKGVTMVEIATVNNISRTTATTKILVLEARGVLTIRQIGNSKIIYDGHRRGRRWSVETKKRNSKNRTVDELKIEEPEVKNE